MKCVEVEIEKEFENMVFDEEIYECKLNVQKELDMYDFKEIAESRLECLYKCWDRRDFYPDLEKYIRRYPLEFRIDILGKLCGAVVYFDDRDSFIQTTLKVSTANRDVWVVCEGFLYGESRLGQVKVDADIAEVIWGGAKGQHAIPDEVLGEMWMWCINEWKSA